jgi:hypothetical protein
MGDEVSTQDREQRLTPADVDERLPKVDTLLGLVGMSRLWLRDEEAAGSNPATLTQVTGHLPGRMVAFGI